MKGAVRRIETKHGTIVFPAYIPVTTFGDKYPLDRLIQPYLPRLSQAVMVSYYYARQMNERIRLPLLIDSGGFAALFEGTRIVEDEGLGVLEILQHESVDCLHPLQILDFQEEHADIAFTFDFPIPPNSCLTEAKRRQRLTIANAIWGLKNRRRKDLYLFACIQGWDRNSASTCAAKLAGHPFDGFAIGGLVPRARDWGLISSMVTAVRSEIGDRPLHVFGLGTPAMTSRLFDLGVDSVDSSSYVKMAADGSLWSDPTFRLADPTPTDRLRLALTNLATATKTNLPLSVQTR